jgi:hypothetical protein
MSRVQEFLGGQQLETASPPPLRFRSGSELVESTRLQRAQSVLRYEPASGVTVKPKPKLMLVSCVEYIPRGPKSWFHEEDEGGVVVTVVIVIELSVVVVVVVVVVAVVVEVVVVGVVVVGSSNLLFRGYGYKNNDMLDIYSR